MSATNMSTTTTKVDTSQPGKDIDHRGTPLLFLLSALEVGLIVGLVVTDMPTWAKSVLAALACTGIMILTYPNPDEDSTTHEQDQIRQNDSTSERIDEVYPGNSDLDAIKESMLAMCESMKSMQMQMIDLQRSLDESKEHQSALARAFLAMQKASTATSVSNTTFEREMSKIVEGQQNSSYAVNDLESRVACMYKAMVRMAEDTNKSMATLQQETANSMSGVINTIGAPKTDQKWAISLWEGLDMMAEDNRQDYLSLFNFMNQLNDRIESFVQDRRSAGFEEYDWWIKTQHELCDRAHDHHGILTPVEKTPMSNSTEHLDWNGGPSNSRSWMCSTVSSAETSENPEAPENTEESVCAPHVDWQSTEPDHGWYVHNDDVCTFSYEGPQPAPSEWYNNEGMTGWEQAPGSSDFEAQLTEVDDEEDGRSTELSWGNPADVESVSASEDDAEYIEEKSSVCSWDTCGDNDWGTADRLST
jgi:hypothetical protein